MTVKVLVVDDEPDVEPLFRQNLRREVKSGKIDLGFAFSGEEAYQKICEDVPPTLMLVFSDINMPGMDGIELLNKIKELRPDMSIFMVTAYGDKDTQEKARRGGAEAFFTKPVDFVALRADLSKYLN